ncbi:MAG: EAL domain-containing protein [Thiomargarita sp.]|nr:EAL domain-containing protein [Thiomargarita sp.]
MQNDIIRLIVIEESANDAEIILNRLRKARYPIRPRYVEDDEDLQDALAEQEWDLIISVPEVYDFNITQICEMVSASKQDIPVIVILEEFRCGLFTNLIKVGARQVVPSDSCLPIVVGKELKDLATRRKIKHLEQLYKESQKHNKILLETSRDAIAYVQDGIHIYTNPSYLKIFAYKDPDDLEGLPVMELITINDQPKFRKFLREFMTEEQLEERQINLEGIKADKKRFKLQMKLSQAIFDSEHCTQVIIGDQSQNVDIERLRRRDSLTNLFNRQYFLELLDNAIARTSESSIKCILFYIALDNINEIIEKGGVGSGDPVIKTVAKIIKSINIDGDLARFDSSVFTLLMLDKDGKKIAAAPQLAEQICQTISETVIELDNKETTFTTCSIGIVRVISSVAGGSRQGILNDAHEACKVAMEEGGNRYKNYKDIMKTDEPNKIKPSDITLLIETAMEENRLSLRFQPIVSLHGETQEIYEVFLRMVDQDGKLVETQDFFEVAEQINFTTLDKWVLKEAIQVLDEQQKNGHETYFFIKISDQAIKDETIILFIRKLLKSSKVAGKQLILEISESVAISQNILTETFITQLNSFGCQSALEHFGTGLNFENTLKLKVNYIKIDSSYIKGLSTNTENQEALQNIVKLAHEYKKVTIAESVEDANSLTILWSSEVDFAQGHYVQEPIENLEFDFSDEEE